MLRNTGIIVLVLGIVSLFSTSYASEPYGAKGAQQTPEPTLEQMLSYAIQDEYLARAEYEHIINQYGSMRPFSNIIKSEETHIGWLIPLFKKYGFQLPKDTSKDHVLVPADLRQAFETGVQAEIDNIAMYEKFLTQQIPDDVKEVFQRLKSASENHLDAFKRGLGRYN